MRSLGRNHVFVACGNPDCYHNTELDVSRFPDDMTFNDLQPRMLCTVCEWRRRWPVVAASWLTGPGDRGLASARACRPASGDLQALSSRQ